MGGRLLVQWWCVCGFIRWGGGWTVEGRGVEYGEVEVLDGVDGGGAREASILELRGQWGGLARGRMEGRRGREGMCPWRTQSRRVRWKELM